MKHPAHAREFVICVSDDGFEASLDVRRVYERIEDRAAGARGLVRVVDESGEDYLFPAALFVPIDVPKAANRAFQASG